MMPHLAETCWRELDQKGLVCDAPWPTPDPAYLVEDSVVMPVQMNGKKRGEITVAKDAPQNEVIKAPCLLTQ